MDYLFAYAVEKAKEHGYASLTEGEKWDWHGDIYGFRRVFCGVPPEEHSSPCDMFGRWFDESRARVSEEHYRALRDAGHMRRERSVDHALYATV